MSDGTVWNVSDHLLASVLDTLRGANWQRGGGKGSKPKAIPRPGGAKEERHGYTDRDPAEVAAYFAKFKPPDVALVD